MNRPKEILLVDDSYDDIFLIKEALKNKGVKLNLTEVYDGDEALNYMLAKEPYQERKLPDLILLDLNMPKKNGFEVLKELKENEKYQHIPVIILTTSKDDNEILESYRNHCSCFIRKPMNFVELEEVIQYLDRFWLKTVAFPSKAS